VRAILSFHDIVLPPCCVFPCFLISIFSSVDAFFGTRVPLLTDKVSKCARGWTWKRINRNGLRRIDTVKALSIPWSVEGEGGRLLTPLLIGDLIQ